MSPGTDRRVALIGAAGQLGRDLNAEASARGWTVVALGHERIEIADADSVRAALDRVEPDLVINTAACQRAAGLPDLPPWRDSLSRYLAEQLQPQPVETPT